MPLQLKDLLADTPDFKDPKSPTEEEMSKFAGNLSRQIWYALVDITPGVIEDTNQSNADPNKVQQTNNILKNTIILDKSFRSLSAANKNKVIDHVFAVLNNSNEKWLKDQFGGNLQNFKQAFQRQLGLPLTTIQKQQPVVTKQTENNTSIHTKQSPRSTKRLSQSIGAFFNKSGERLGQLFESTKDLAKEKLHRPKIKR